MLRSSQMRRRTSLVNCFPKLQTLSGVSMICISLGASAQEQVDQLACSPLFANCAANQLPDQTAVSPNFQRCAVLASSMTSRLQPWQQVVDLTQRFDSTRHATRGCMYELAPAHETRQHACSWDMRGIGEQIVTAGSCSSIEIRSEIQCWPLAGSSSLTAITSFTSKL